MHNRFGMENSVDRITEFLSEIQMTSLNLLVFSKILLPEVSSSGSLNSDSSERKLRVAARNFSISMIDQFSGFSELNTSAAGKTGIIFCLTMVSENGENSGLICFLESGQNFGFSSEENISEDEILDSANGYKLYFATVSRKLSFSYESRTFSLYDSEKTLEEELNKPEPDFSDYVIVMDSQPYKYDFAQNLKEAMDGANVNSILVESSVVVMNLLGFHNGRIWCGGGGVGLKGEKTLQELPCFDPFIFSISENDKSEPFKIDKSIRVHEDGIEEISEALIFGIRGFMYEISCSKVILGLSGGIDSAVVAALLVEALGSENVLGVMMPSYCTSDASNRDAECLAANLGIETLSLPITEILSLFDSILVSALNEPLGGLTVENLQSRLRGNMLMALANQLNGIVVCTGNKSEKMTGYCTLYGDTCGAFAPLGDLFKTRVYELAEYINRRREVIPEDIIRKMPSAELRPGQLDIQSLPSYDILDDILELYLNSGENIKSFEESEYDEAIVAHVAGLIDSARFKARQSPPVILLS
ncbi:MAG: NAD(+) synthase [Candidatus Wallbacteria bacterium HGW-Wallbacteria-1]|uniref:NH(3)-dependent NAD(+) synthetase n=1 Tax=Candidatus Wallbacteria bacterium HGW-Wallbacteria-1 TaxID=2013854 RepID=A0A2N1PRH6_9BACT|nr:MAG: NAD(+) synthase [Candidatus Wallbacteria bacterium HGW-Wallbacteria-1]